MSSNLLASDRTFLLSSKLSAQLRQSCAPASSAPSRSVSPSASSVRNRKLLSPRVSLCGGGLSPKSANAARSLLIIRRPSCKEDRWVSQHMRTIGNIDSWWLDIKLGIRMLIKYPGLALAGGAGIAVAVAISAGMYSFIYTNVLVTSSLPVEEGARIVSVEIWDTAAGRPERRSLYDYHVWREGLKSVQ